MSRFEEINDASIAALVDSFYAKVRQNPTIGPLFNTVIDDWEDHLERLRAFWSAVMLTTGRYKGSPMAAHMRLPIEPSFFDQWLALWHETAAEMFTPEVAAQFSAKAERIAESLKLGLAFRPPRNVGE